MTKYPYHEGASEVGGYAPAFSPLPVVTQATGGIALIGSGELADAMAETHRALMSRLDSPVRPVFLDTPAGFESNIDAIDRKAVEYFRRNFGFRAWKLRATAPVGKAPTTRALRCARSARPITFWPGQEARVHHPCVAREPGVASHSGALARGSAAGVRERGGAQRGDLGQKPRYGSTRPDMTRSGLRAWTCWVLPASVGSRWCPTGIMPAVNMTRATAIWEQRVRDAGAAATPQTRSSSAWTNTADCSFDLTWEKRQECAGSGRVTLRTAGRQSVYARGDLLTLHHPHTDAEEVPVSLPTMLVPQRENGDDAQDADILATRVRVEQAFARRDIPEAVDGLIALSLLAGSGFEQSLPGRAELAVQALQGTLPGLIRLLEAIDGAEKAQQESKLLIGALLVSTRAVVRDSRRWAEANGCASSSKGLGYVIADTPARVHLDACEHTDR